MSARESELRELLRDATVRLDEQRRMTDAADGAAERRLDQSIKWMERAEAAEDRLRRVEALADEWIADGYSDEAPDTIRAIRAALEENK